MFSIISPRSYTIYHWWWYKKQKLLITECIKLNLQLEKFCICTILVIHLKTVNRTAVIVMPDCSITFQPISNRISMITTITKNNSTSKMVSWYAPLARILKKTTQDPEQTRKFYNLPSSIIKKTKKRGVIIVLVKFYKFLWINLHMIS